MWVHRRLCWLRPRLKELFQPHSGQKTVSMCSNALHCNFIAHMMLKSCNRHRKSGPMWSQIASWTTHVGLLLLLVFLLLVLLFFILLLVLLLLITVVTFSINSRNTNAFVMRSPRCTLCYGWRVGLVHARCYCNHIRDNRYRDSTAVTLN